MSTRPYNPAFGVGSFYGLDGIGRKSALLPPSRLSRASRRLCCIHTLARAERFITSCIGGRSFMAMRFGESIVAAILALGIGTPAIAEDIVFDSVRIFDGKSPVLSAQSNVLVKGNVIVRIT